MPEANALPATVVFFSLAEFGARPVAEQATLKETLEAALVAAVAPVPDSKRIVVDTREGAAVVLLDGPGSALDLADRVRAAATALPLAIGINHGPIKLALNGAHGAALFGDGLTAGASIASFARPGTTLVSRSFRDSLAESAPERADSMHAAGVFTDTAVRSHEVFAPGRKAGAFRRRRLLVLGALGVAGILATGVVARRRRQRVLATARTPAVVALAIAPGGEVLVDGQVRGMTPPLKTLELTPGRHTIVVRTGDHAPLTTHVELAPGERFALNHVFPPPAPPPAAVETPPAPPPVAKATPPAATPAKPQRQNSASTATKRKSTPATRNVQEDFRSAGRQMRDFFRGLTR